jgi:hypothetical protein
MITYRICNNYSELEELLEESHREIRYSDSEQRIYNNDGRILRDLNSILARFENYEAATEISARRKAAFAEVSMWIQDMTAMLYALRTFNGSLRHLHLYEKPDVSATVPDAITRSLELKMQQSYKSMAELADNMILQPPVNSPYTDYKVSRKQLQLLTGMLVATDELYKDHINPNKMAAFSKAYSALPSQTNWHQLARIGRVILGLTMIVCAFIPPLTLVMVASVPVLTVSLFLAGVATCWSYLLAPRREIFRSNNTLQDLEKLNRDMKSYQALPQVGLLRAAASVPEPTVVRREVEESMSRLVI